jgi:hypothetical protein
MLVNHFSLSFSMMVLQFYLNIFFILEDLETNCSVLLPGEDDMDDGMPELEDYDDVVANILMDDGLLMVDGLPQNRGSLHVHLLWYSAAQC